MKTIITVENYITFQPNAGNKYTTEELNSAINLTYTLLDAEVGGAITDRWDEPSTSEKYLTDSQKDHIKNAFLIETQYVLMNGLDFSQGTDQFSLGSFNMSSNRPNRNLISPQALKELQLAGIWYQTDFVQARNGAGRRSQTLADDMNEPLWNDYPLPETVSDQRYLHRKNTASAERIIAYDNQGIAEYLTFNALLRDSNNNFYTVVTRGVNGTFQAADPILDQDVLTLHYFREHGGDHGGQWGRITGTLSNQTDLWNALESKSSVSVSATGTSTTPLPSYMTIDGTEYLVTVDTSNFVTINTNQTISGGKTFTNWIEQNVGTTKNTFDSTGITTENTSTHKSIQLLPDGYIYYGFYQGSVYQLDFPDQSGTFALKDQTVQNQHTAGLIVRDAQTSTSTTQRRVEIKPNAYVMYDSTTNGLTQYTTTGIYYFTGGSGYTLSYPTKTGTLLTSADLSTALADYYTKTQCDEKYLVKDTDNLVNQTCDDLLAFAQDPGTTIVFTDIQFTTAESPDEESETRWECEVHRSNITTEGPSAYIIAKSNSGIYKNNYNNETWGGWEKYATQNWVDFYYYNKNYISSNYYGNAYIDNNFYTKTQSDNKYCECKKENYVTQTRAGLFATTTTVGQTINYNTVLFTAAESPTGSAVSQFQCEVHRTGAYPQEFGYIIAKNREGIYICNIYYDSATSSVKYSGWQIMPMTNWARGYPTALTTYVKTNNSWYFKVGRLVIANINYSLQSSIAQGTQVYSGFPRAETNTYVAVSGDCKSHYVDSNGNLYSNGSQTGGWVFGCLVYLEKQ